MELPKPPERTGGMFLKLKDKESIVVVFRGTPHFFYKKWKDGKSQICEEGEEGASWSFRINAVVKEEGAYVAKIWESGVTFYQQLIDINLEYPLETTAVKISRNGVGTDTSYSILPMTKVQVNAAAMGDVKLNELTPKKKSVDAEDFPGWDDSEMKA